MTREDFSSLLYTTPAKYLSKLAIITVSIALILFTLLFLPWQQTVTADGVLIAQNPSERSYTVSATIDGFVDKLYIQENQIITTGDPLFDMRDIDHNYGHTLQNINNNITNQISLTNDELSNLQYNLANLHTQLINGENILTNKISQASDKLNSLQLKHNILTQNLETEKLNFTRIKQLFIESLESKRNLEKAENSFVDAQNELQKNTIDYTVQKKEIVILSKEKQQFSLELNAKIKSIENSINSSLKEKGGLDNDLNTQSNTLSRFNSSSVKSQKDGVVLKVLVNDKNQFIKKGEPILEFAPKVSIHTIRVKIPNFHMPLIKTNLPVRIMFYGWPAFQVSGWPKIKHGTFSGFVERVDPMSVDEKFVYAYITEDPKEPWPKDSFLKLGTKTSVWFRLATVPLWFEIWRGFNASPAIMVTPGKDA